MFGDQHRGLQLYIRRVFIMHNCEALLPNVPALCQGRGRFARPAAEHLAKMLQQHAPLEKIKSNLVNKVLKTLEEMKKQGVRRLPQFLQGTGHYLKEGVGQDWKNRERLADLLLFESTKTEPGKFTTCEVRGADAGRIRRRSTT